MRDIKNIPINEYIRIYYRLYDKDILRNEIGVLESIDGINIKPFVLSKFHTDSGDNFFKFFIEIDNIDSWDYLDEEDK